ncbi:MAG: biotin carboxyl carrier protein [Paraglaciecola sp.]
MPKTHLQLMSYKINIDDQVFDLNRADIQDLNLIENGDKTLHLLQDNQSYHISVIQTDFDNKKLTLEINGNPYEINIEDEYDQLVKKMGLSTGGAQKLKNIKAPMPGLILDILVEPGQAIEKGDQLLILEAMKMENVLKAEGEGVVKSIEVVKGAAVDKGQVMIEME